MRRPISSTGGLIRSFVRALIRAYQLLISPLLGPRCRFHPSCSQYALDAIALHGTLRGGVLALRRVSHCHPWHPGGYDPVPAAAGPPGAASPPVQHAHDADHR